MVNRIKTKKFLCHILIRRRFPEGLAKKVAVVLAALLCCRPVIAMSAQDNGASEADIGNLINAIQILKTSPRTNDKIYKSANTITDPIKEMQHYTRKVDGEVRRVWDMRECIKHGTGKISGVTTIMIRVSKDGSLSKVYIEKSSGDINFDRCVMGAVGNIKYFDPPPREMIKNEDSINLLFNFINN